MVSISESDKNAAGSEVRDVLILGGGTAGLITGITLKRLRPSLAVSIVRDGETDLPDESTSAVLPAHLFDTLGVAKDAFYKGAQPTWKRGTRFLWGPREEFFTDFEIQYDQAFQGLPKAAGYYAAQDCQNLSQASALMGEDLLFPSGPLGKPIIKGRFGFHMDHDRLLKTLEVYAKQAGVEIQDSELDRADVADGQITRLQFKDGSSRTADLFIDASGAEAKLIGGALDEPFQPFSSSLPCDRMLIGEWQRKEDEPIHSYTTMETMDHGWAWQVEHELVLRRGYVYSSSYVSDDEAKAEFRAKNPELGDELRRVSFQSGRRARNWVGNVIAVGDASGYAEPLLGTALTQTIHEARWIAESIRLTGGSPDAAMKSSFNRVIGVAWDEIRDLLAILYKFNTRRSTPFWQHCRENTSLGNHEALVTLFNEIGPSPITLSQLLPGRPHNYGMEGLLELLVGMQVSYERRHLAAPSEFDQFNQQRGKIATSAKGGLTVKQTLDAIRKSGWQWT